MPDAESPNTPAAAPVPSPVPVPEAEIQIQTIPDQFYGTALRAKAPIPPKPSKGGEASPPVSTGKNSVPWMLPVGVGVGLLLIVAAGFWYFNPNLFAPAPAPVVVEPEPTPPPPPPPEPPAAPQNVAATSTEGGSVRITWQDTSTNEAGFRVERRDPTTPFVPLTSLPPNATLFLDTTTTWERSYLYRVIAINSDGESISANEATVTVPPNPVVIPEPVTLPPVGLDTDSDGLTDLEEPLYGSPLRDPDADKDTFLDGNEVFHLYTPSGKAPGRLLDSGLVRLLESPAGWHVSIPVTWQATVNSGTGTILTGHGETFTISVEPLPVGTGLMDWYLAKNPGVLSSQVERFTTKGGLEGIQETDSLTAYFPWGNQVLTFQYRLEGQPFVNFRTTYEMMKNSLLLDPPKAVVAPSSSVATTTSSGVASSTVSP